MMKRKLTLISLVVAAALLFGACTGETTVPTTSSTGSTTKGTTAATTGTTTATAETTKELETIYLDLMMFSLKGFDDKINTALESPVFDEIEKQTGVRLSFTGLTGDQTDVIMASRSTTDLLTVVSVDQCNRLIEADMVIPLDDLIQTMAPNVRDLYPERLESSRSELSNGTGKIYFLPSNAGTNAVPIREDISLYTLRWDYYAAMGYPSVSSPEDMLAVLVDMQALYPENPDGQKTYGISGTFATLAHRFYYTHGYEIADNSNQQAWINIKDIELNMMYGTEDSIFWDAIKYVYKANQLGIMDPEYLTQTEEDYTNKVKTGRVLSPDIRWLGITEFNSQAELEYPDEGIGFATIPVEAKVWNPGESVAGWGPTFSLSIASTCKDPERAMMLIDYLYGYEGSRLINTGVQGRDWEYKDGKPVLTNFGLTKWLTGGDSWEIKTLFTYLSNFCGIKAGTISPDGGQVNLYQDAAIYSRTMLSVDKAMSSYYGVSFPFEKIVELVEAGKAVRADNWDSRIQTATGSAGEDIARIDVKMASIAETYLPQIILAKSDAEFDALKAAMISEMKANGYDTSVADWMARFNAAKAKYGK
ncbi:MAG: hypothetical protein SCM11_15515 [Bacillota bacterium]|nr:hypothetical protein [Bacillota bacterium]